MEKQLSELASKVKALRFRLSKTDEAIAKDDREACKRQKDSISNISKLVIDLKESIEEKRFSKGESEEQIAEWGAEFEAQLEKTDACLRKLTQRIKEIDLREEEAKNVMTHKQNMMFEQELLEQKAAYESKLKDEGHANQNNKLSGAKLPKLPITKFNGTYEAWLPFWGKFSSEIDSASLPTLTKFSYLKELLEPSIREGIDGLPFTEEGYLAAKEMLKAEYSQDSEIVNAYIKNIMSLPVITGTNPKKIDEFYRQLRYNVQSLDTMGKLADVKGNVRSTLDKLKGIKSDLVRGHEGWQDWGFKDLLAQIKIWREIHPVEENTSDARSGKQKTPLFHTRDLEHETAARACVYCEENTHKSVECTKVANAENRKKLLARKGRCFNCTGSQHQAANCKSKSRCRKCKRKHHTSICDEPPPQETAQSNCENTVVYPVVIVDVEGVKCRALLDTGAGDSYASAALLDRLSKRESKRETKKIEMMLGTTTREMEQQTITVKGISEQFSMPIEVTKVEKGELPWRGNHPPLPNNKSASIRRLQGLVRKLESKNQMAQYKEIIDEQREAGIIEPAEHQAVGNEFYIPHKPVVRPCAESTKMRVVYDASARAYDGAPSLNDCLHTGPSLENKLWNVLVRGRFYPVALSGDLQKAFLQVRIKADDRDALRFHWQESAGAKVETLRFTRALFGLTTSPFLLGGVIDSHLSTWEEREPETVQNLKRELYVDDLISGSTTVKKALEVKAKTSGIFEDACFHLHKWHSNSPELESDLAPATETTYAKENLKKPDGGASSLLGLKWNRKSDCLSVTFPEEPAVPTKRGVLTKLAKIYDPLGVASPATLSGKLLYRTVCDLKKPWDAPIPNPLRERCINWENGLSAEFEFPRSLAVHREPITNIELHSFGDASGSGLAACVYAVVQQPSGSNQGLVAARSRLAKPQTTIPRLELLAAHMAVNLVKNVKEAITGFPVNEITCWSDSTVVLYWLQGTETYKQFVASRVTKIHSHEDVGWRYVPSGENPADMGSRGDQSNKRELWLNGPKWLQDPDTWPSNIVAQPSIESRAETKPAKEIVNVAVVQRNERDEVLAKFGLQKAVRVCSWIYRFENNALRSPGADRVEGPLTTTETNRQRTLFIKQAQRNDGCEEDRTALNLKPNEMGVLVCHGRVQGELPIYVPDSAMLAQKIVEEAHMLTLHGGIGLTMTQVRKRYWIPRLRRLVRKIRRKCHGCKRFTVTAYPTPTTSKLPTTRTQGINPYQVIGVDYAGPIRYRKKRGQTGKAYVLLYACSLTRGIYIDLLSSLELTEFILSLKRFIARRGRPDRIYSDNGGTFIGAARWMRIVAREERIQNFLSVHQITWQFNLSRAPWWGGQFERMIGLVKGALGKTIGNGFLAWKELEEVLLDVEITLNNRPLGYVEDDIQLPVLTPNNMLYLNSNTLPEFPPHEIEDRDLRRRAKHLLKCKAAVWKRWSQEYLRSLRERHRNLLGAKGAVPVVGDVVILKTDEKSRGKWPLGIIEELIVGKDGVVRAAKVRTGKNQLERAIQHLFPLELSCDRRSEEVQLNPEVESFKPKRQAAQNAGQRIREIIQEEDGEH